MFDTNMQGWGPDYVKRHPDVTMMQIEAFLTRMYKANPDFVWAVNRDFVRQCRTPVLILPDDIPAHPYKVAMRCSGNARAGNAEVSMFPLEGAQGTNPARNPADSIVPPGEQSEREGLSAGTVRRDVGRLLRRRFGESPQRSVRDRGRRSRGHTSPGVVPRRASAPARGAPPDSHRVWSAR